MVTSFKVGSGGRAYIDFTWNLLMTFPPKLVSRKQWSSSLVSDPFTLNPDVWRKSPGTLGEMIDFQSIPHHALSRIIHHYHPLLDSGIASNVMAHYTHKAKSFAAMPLAPPRWPSEPVASCEGSQCLLNSIINVDINGYTDIHGYE